MAKRKRSKAKAINISLDTIICFPKFPIMSCDIVPPIIGFKFSADKRRKTPFKTIELNIIKPPKAPRTPSELNPSPNAMHQGDQTKASRQGKGDEETPLNAGIYPDDLNAFSDKNVRRGFIWKVYSILLVQLALTVGIISFFMYHEPTRKYVAAHPSLYLIAFLIFLVCLISLACCDNCRRRSPGNYLLLYVFTLVESFMLATITINFNIEEIMTAAAMTTVVCLGLTIFAFQTKWDFTMMGGMLFVSVIILMIFGIITIFIHDKVAMMIYASLGALVFSCYLVYDTQIMLDGKHAYSISPEEYVFAALNLYVDIIQIFLYILTIIGGGRD